MPMVRHSHVVACAAERPRDRQGGTVLSIGHEYAHLGVRVRCRQKMPRSRERNSGMVLVDDS